ncbi:MAG: ribonuclease R [Chitinophagales bacterium]
MSKKRQNRRKKQRNTEVKNSSDIQRLILDEFKNHPAKSFSDKQIVNKFLANDKRSNIQQAIIELLEKEEIIIVPPGRMKLNKSQEITEYEGRIDITKSGAGYVIVDGLEQDIYVSSRNTKRAFDGDIVKVEKIMSSRRSRTEGVVIEIVRRKKEAFIGVVSKTNGYTFVIPGDASIPIDFYIGPDDESGAKENDKVVVRIKDWPKKSKNPFGEIIEILGQSGSSDIEMQSILVENGFRLSFPDAVMREVNDLPTEIPQEEYKKRRDFRKITTFTIDPEDAKDFDDAISVRRLENLNWEIGVHIADVSFYATPGSELDKEALKRSTSVYLVDRVLPMFPEQLSNVICSLRPKEEKLCYAAVFELDDNAEVIKEWFGRTIIYSDKRFTYDDAQQLIEGNEGDLSEEVLAVNRLAEKLRKKRFDKGSINFDSPEVKFKLDENAKPIGVYVKERKEANLLIEDFMLLANKRVARFVGEEKNKNGKTPLVYRVHDMPDLDKLNDFRLFASKFGYNINLENPKAITKSLNKFLADVHGKPEQGLLEQLAIRSMSKAIYTTENIGHFGLGFEFYAHFTSPIRRYPDVLVHRILDDVLNGKTPPSKTILEAQAKHCSTMERAAMTAERESIKYKMAEYMSEHIGDTFPGVISGVKNWGIYVDIPQFNCEGMIKAEFLSDDTYAYNEREMLFKGLRTGKKFQLGDPITVTIHHVDMEKRTIDLMPNLEE